MRSGFLPPPSSLRSKKASSALNIMLGDSKRYRLLQMRNVTRLTIFFAVEETKKWCDTQEEEKRRVKEFMNNQDFTNEQYRVTAFNCLEGYVDIHLLEMNMEKLVRLSSAIFGRKELQNATQIIIMQFGAIVAKYTLGKDFWISLLPFVLGIHHVGSYFERFIERLHKKREKEIWSNEKITKRIYFIERDDCSRDYHFSPCRIRTKSQAEFFNFGARLVLRGKDSVYGDWGSLYCIMSVGDKKMKDAWNRFNEAGMMYFEQLDFMKNNPDEEFTGDGFEKARGILMELENERIPEVLRYVKVLLKLIEKYNLSHQ